jgi:hypothetical protein
MKYSSDAIGNRIRDLNINQLRHRVPKERFYIQKLVKFVGELV